MIETRKDQLQREVTVTELWELVWLLQPYQILKLAVGSLSGSLNTAFGFDQSKITGMGCPEGAYSQTQLYAPSRSSPPIDATECNQGLTTQGTPGS